MSNFDFNNTFSYKLIYVFRINDERHSGYLKIGDATIHTDKDFSELPPNCHDLNNAAKQRIADYTNTAGIPFDLLYTEIAVYKNTDPNSEKFGKVLAFRDYDVHSVLKRSGISQKFFDTGKRQNEWFECDLATAKEAIKAVKNNQSALDGSQITTGQSPIVFRPEQIAAIEKTIKQFKNSDRMLWNAKMRFGKTLTALEIAKRNEYPRTIIMTHRPVVNKGWYDDFQKIFYDRDDYAFGSKTMGRSLEDLEASGKKYVYFVSIEDLRGSKRVGGEYDKNEDIFDTNWDFVIVDEAHEGTKTDLGKAVYKAVIKPDDEEHITKTLELSGTPFNLLVDYENGEIFTWDYIMEQQAKQDWARNHFGDSNPYEDLPKLNIFTYHLEDSFKKYVDLEDRAFKFGEFFRVWTGDIFKDYERMPEGAAVGDFVHEDDVKAFLNLICEESDTTNYPFSTERYREYFRHTLWVVPGVKEAKALSKLLHAHPVFSQFEIVNVAGDGDEEIDSRDALRAVKNAFGSDPSSTYTITLSCGRLTTGVSVPEWTAVLILAGSYSTQASQYLQTIFRVQTPANINGKMKENCYVFDFAPDRTLKMVAESVQLSQKGAGSVSAEVCLGKFLNFCPIISVQESEMKEFKVSYLLQELKRAYVERVVRNGFDDIRLYNNDSLLKLTDIELKDFKDLESKVGSSRAHGRLQNIDINAEGFTDEQYERFKKLKKKKKNERTPEEEKELEEARKRNAQRRNAIAILRSISIRIPLLVYGADVPVEQDITVDSFVDLVDSNSWKEFMPDGVTKSVFRKFTKYYDKDVFAASTSRVRRFAKSADELEPTERIKKLAELFTTFRNPDKETVLTPWRVVNMHMSETIGGYDFWNDDHSEEINEPRFVNHKGITDKIFRDPNGKVLEINSKSGLYPLYLAYTFYRAKCDNCKEDELTLEKRLEIWDEVVKDNIYVVCKSKMAKQITKRTLLGYREGRINARAFDDLIQKLRYKSDKFVNKVTLGKTWSREATKMKFSAVVGNPPYQGVNHQQIYPFFYLASIALGHFVSLIFPIGWQQPSNANNLAKLNNVRVKRDPRIRFINNVQNVFPGISGAEWVNIILWQKDFDNKLHGSQNVYTNGEDLKVIELPINQDSVEKPAEIVKLCEIVQNSTGFISLQTQTSTSKPYGLRKNAFGMWEEYNIEPMHSEKTSEDDIAVYGSNGRIMYAPQNYKFPKMSPRLHKYKVFVGSAWGNMDEKSGLGGSYANIILAGPNDACTETYQESGSFDDLETARKHAKFLMTKFCRACLYLNKFSQMSTQSWAAVPIQDYHEDWWNLSIEEIDDKLFIKYNVPEDIVKFIKKHIQTKFESNIINF